MRKTERPIHFPHLQISATRDETMWNSCKLCEKFWKSRFNFHMFHKKWCLSLSLFLTVSLCVVTPHPSLTPWRRRPAANLVFVESTESVNCDFWATPSGSRSGPRWQTKRSSKICGRFSEPPKATFLRAFNSCYNVAVFTRSTIFSSSSWSSLNLKQDVWKKGQFKQVETVETSKKQ